MIYVMIFCVCFGLALDKTGPIIGRSVTPDTLKSAYSVRYSLTNIGAFFGPFLVGILYTKVFAHGTVQGFRPCFKLAALVMLIGCIWFTLGMFLKGGEVGKKPFKAEKTEEELAREAAQRAANKEVKLTLNTNEKKRILAIILVSAFQIVFWLFWDLASLPVYYYWTKNMTWKIGNFTVPTTWFDALSALYCVILGPITALLWQRLEARPQGDMSIFKKPTPVPIPEPFSVSDIKVESSTCTGEKTIGFFDKTTNRLAFAELVRTEKDIANFYKKYGIDYKGDK